MIRPSRVYPRFVRMSSDLSVVTVAIQAVTNESEQSVGPLVQMNQSEKDKKSITAIIGKSRDRFMAHKTTSQENFTFSTPQGEFSWISFDYNNYVDELFAFQHETRRNKH